MPKPLYTRLDDGWFKMEESVKELPDLRACLFRFRKGARFIGKRLDVPFIVVGYRCGAHLYAPLYKQDGKIARILPSQVEAFKIYINDSKRLQYREFMDAEKKIAREIAEEEKKNG